MIGRFQEHVPQTGLSRELEPNTAPDLSLLGSFSLFNLTYQSSMVLCCTDLDPCTLGLIFSEAEACGIWSPASDRILVVI